MLQVASVLSGCCVCFTHMVKCICFKWYAFRRILHSSVSYFRCVFRESWGTESYRRGRARPHPVSQVPPARREGSGVAGKETWAQRQGRVRVRSVARWTRRVTWASQRACPYRRPALGLQKKKIHVTSQKFKSVPLIETLKIGSGSPWFDLVGPTTKQALIPMNLGTSATQDPACHGAGDCVQLYDVLLYLPLISGR
jgi:hypothetical protein